MGQIGKFITFEGGEGSGKSTQSRLLAEALIKSGITALHTREPGGTEGAEAIRGLLVQGDVNRWDAMTEALLNMAARRDHVKKKIQPALETGQWVVSDRFVHSTLAYQAYGHGLGQEMVEALHRMVIGRIWPCLVFVLDIDVQQGMERAQKRKEINRYEAMDKAFHEKVRQGFLAAAKQDPHRVVVLDATQSLEALHRQIIGEVNTRFGVQL